MKNKKISAPLSLLFPGLGHFYIGKYVDGAVFFLGAGILWYAIWYRNALLIYFNNPRSFLVWGALVFVYLFSIADSYRKTKSTNMPDRGKYSLANGLPAKILLIPGILIFLALIFYIGFGRGILPNIPEYKKDQAHLTATMKTKFLEEPLSEVKYPIKGYRIPGLGGFCWLESSSGLIKYLEPDVDFDTFIFYGRPTLVMAGRDKNERWGPGLSQTHAFAELGYTAFRGSTNPTHLPQSVFPDIDPRNLIYFKTPEEELAFIKNLVSARIIPTIGYDGDFSTVIGYNKDGLWIVKSDASQTDKEGRNFMTYPVSFEPIFVTYKELFDNWGMDYQFFWFEKTGSRKSIDEVYMENKKNATEAAQNMTMVIEFLKNGGNLTDFTYEIDIPSAMTLYRYFTKQGNTDLANKYLEIAKIYEFQRASLGPDSRRSQSEARKFYIETLTKARPLLAEVATMWP
ncbi:MAG: hypothetical protein HY980_01315 [Candidatus Magasanikbacteria bacterium]|nr:hypothetical protein [Candidatus Magasanikbacteria bacterium]